MTGHSNSPFATKSCVCPFIAFLPGIISLSVEYTKQQTSLSNVENCHCVLGGWRVLDSKSQFVNWLPWFLFGFLCTSSQIQQQKFKLDHNRLYFCSSLPSHIALLTTDCHLVGNVKKSVGSNKIEFDEWLGSVSNISCPGIKNLGAAGLKRLILKDFYTEWRRSG